MAGDDNRSLLPTPQRRHPGGTTPPRRPGPRGSLTLFQKHQHPPAARTSPSSLKNPLQLLHGLTCAAYVNAGDNLAGVSLTSVRLPVVYILSGDCNYPFEVDDADPDNYSQDTPLRSRQSPFPCP